MTHQTNAGHAADPMAADRTRLYLVRHGELTTSHEWRYVGHRDVALNATGIQQFQKLSNYFSDKSLDVILSSDLRRAAHSAGIIGDAIGLVPVKHADFREINLGRWEGMTREEIIARFPREFEQRSANIAAFTIQDGESFDAVHSRAVSRLMSVLASYRGKNILLVAHGGVNRVILCHALGLSLNNIPRIGQEYACINIIDFYKGDPVVSLVNMTVQ